MTTSDNIQSNPLLEKSDAPFGAPRFDLINNGHYLPAFNQAITQAKAEIDAIIDNPQTPTFENTVEALEYSGRTLDNVEGIFFNLLEADSDVEKEGIAEKVSPQLTEYQMYVLLNQKLFSRIMYVYHRRSELPLEKDQLKLLEDTYKDFSRNGANLNDSDKKLYAEYCEKLSLLELKFGNNTLAATNSFTMNLTDPQDLEGLPEYVKDMAAQSAKERKEEGWTFTLDYPSYDPFMKFSSRADLRQKMWMAYNSKGIGEDSDNTQVIRDIVSLRIKIANLLGYKTYADYALEDRMAKSKETVERFLSDLMTPTLPFARNEIAMILSFAQDNGYQKAELEPWDFKYWAERYKQKYYSLNEEILKPYFKLEYCVVAIFDLAHRLYGISFEERHDIPVYQKDVRVFDVKDEDGSHLALFYMDFFPRKSKRGGAWMTEFRGQYSQGGKDFRPFVSIVTNLSKPTAKDPSLLTHYEFTTLLHEFGHSLHGMLSKGRYPSQCGTNVATDFVELPSQLMENWAYESEYLDTFAKHYKSGEVIPAELVDRISKAKNYLSGYQQVRQLQFGEIDMAWHTLICLPEEGTVEFEHKVLKPYAVLPTVEVAAQCPSFGHIFSGGYSAGYYSYKWAEVLEADAFELFKEKGIFSREVAASFRENVLSKGSSEDESILYRRFRGHDPEPEALMRSLGLE